MHNFFYPSLLLSDRVSKPRRTVDDRLAASGLKPCALRLDWGIIRYWALHFNKRAIVSTMFHFKKNLCCSSIHV
jgi:hypothetical protein